MHFQVFVFTNATLFEGITNLLHVNIVTKFKFFKTITTMNYVIYHVSQFIEKQHSFIEDSSIEEL